MEFPHSVYTHPYREDAERELILLFAEHQPEKAPQCSCGAIIGVFNKAQDLTKISQWLLFQRLRVADVAVDNFLSLFFKLLSSVHNRSADGILRRQQIRIQILLCNHDSYLTNQQ